MNVSITTNIQLTELETAALKKLTGNITGAMILAAGLSDRDKIIISAIWSGLPNLEVEE